MPDQVTSPENTVAVLAALPNELAPAIKQLRLRKHERVYTSQRGPNKIVADTSGIGASRAAKKFEHLITTYHPNRLILIGFAGGLVQRLAPGQVIRIRRAIDEHGHAFELSDDAPPTPASHDAQTTSDTLLTVDRLIHDVQAKHRLHEQYGAALVDMETITIARLAAQHALPLTVLRAVSDPADTALPVHATRWISPDGHTRMWSALCHVLLHPQHIPTLFRLCRYARRAANNLAECTRQLIESYT